MDEQGRYKLAIFASDQGSGSPERSSIMSQAGSFFAKKGQHIVCPVFDGVLNVPLVKSARAAGGEVTVVAGADFRMPSALSGISLEQFPGKTEQQQRLGELADAFVGLPGSLASATGLFETWVATGAGKPVTLLNRNRAYEVMRGFAADIISHSAKDWEKRLQFADNIEDLWNRLMRMLAAR